VGDVVAPKALVLVELHDLVQRPAGRVAPDEHNELVVVAGRRTDGIDDDPIVFTLDQVLRLVARVRRPVDRRRVKHSQLTSKQFALLVIGPAIEDEVLRCEPEFTLHLGSGSIEGHLTMPVGAGVDLDSVESVSTSLPILLSVEDRSRRNRREVREDQNGFDLVVGESDRVRDSHDAPCSMCGAGWGNRKVFVKVL